MAPMFVVAIAIGLIGSSSASAYSISKFEDITVTNKNGVLQCDEIECPARTERCHVSKENTEENLEKVKRENICYDADDKILEEMSWTEEYKGMKRVSLHIDMYSNGRSSVTNTHRAYAEDIGFGIVESVGSILKQVGSFLSNLF